MCIINAKCNKSTLAILKLYDLRTLSYNIILRKRFNINIVVRKLYKYTVRVESCL